MLEFYRLKSVGNDLVLAFCQNYKTDVMDLLVENVYFGS